MSPEPIDCRLLAQFRSFLDATMYALVDLRLSFEAPVGATGFPRYEQAQAVVGRLDPATQTVFRLFRLGEAVADRDVRHALPSDLLEGMASADLICRTEGGGWRTSDLLLVPIEGLYLFVSTPPSYPTATRPADVWFDLSSHVLAKALPTSLDDARILDLCCGSGFLGILCARRGAIASLGLDISEAAIRIAAINAALNGVDDKVAFRRSDRLAALDADERFGLVVCNTPHAPAVAPSPTLERIGNLVLLDMIDDIPRHLSPDGRGIVATWRAGGQGGQTAQHAYLAGRLAAQGMTTRAFVDRAPDTTAGVVKILAADAVQRLGADGQAVADQAAAVLEKAAIDGFYNQVIALGRHDADGQDACLFGLDLGSARTTA